MSEIELIFHRKERVFPMDVDEFLLGCSVEDPFGQLVDISAGTYLNEERRYNLISATRLCLKDGVERIDNSYRREIPGYIYRDCNGRRDRVFFFYASLPNTSCFSWCCFDPMAVKIQVSYIDIYHNRRHTALNTSDMYNEIYSSNTNDFVTAHVSKGHHLLSMDSRTIFSKGKIHRFNDIDSGLVSYVKLQSLEDKYWFRYPGVWPDGTRRLFQKYLD